MLNLAVVLEDSARATPDRDAVVLCDRRLTYAELDAAAAQVAHLLTELSIGPGDKVALSCPNVPYFPIVYYGILKTGATVVPLNMLLKAREIAYHLTDSGAKAYFCFEGTDELPLGREGWTAFQETDACEEFFLLTTEPSATSTSIPGARPLTSAVAGRPATFEAAPTEPTDTAVILYTNGTTGRAKGVELSHANMLLNALTCHRLFGMEAHDVHLVTLPLFHSFGQTVQMNAGLGAGATLCSCRGSTPAPQWRPWPPSPSPSSRASRRCTGAYCAPTSTGSTPPRSGRTCGRRSPEARACRWRSTGSSRNGSASPS